MAVVSASFSLPIGKHTGLKRSPGKAFAVAAGAGVKVTEGEGNLPKVILSTPNGSEAELYLYGGCATSWKISSGKDILFVRPDAVFNKKKPISGGIPHCFPQFGPGAIQQHGFARNMDWSLDESQTSDEETTATFVLTDGPYSRAIWDFAFHALYKVTLKPKSLCTELVITNTDNKPFSFSTALHTYFNAAIEGVKVKGLKGCRTLDKSTDPNNPTAGVDERDVVSFPGFVDCIYLNAPNAITLENGVGEEITIQNTNWTDVVLWNPHVQMEACYRNFVCVENAKIEIVELGQGQKWNATQILTVT